MGRKKKRSYTSDEKVQVLRRHLVEKVAVSDLCDEYLLHPNIFYRWQREFFEKGAVVFEHKGDSEARKFKAKISALTAKLSHKEEVIDEIMESHARLKKSLGED